MLIAHLRKRPDAKSSTVEKHSFQKYTSPTLSERQNPLYASQSEAQAWNVLDFPLTQSWLRKNCDFPRRIFDSLRIVVESKHRRGESISGSDD